MSQDQSLSCGWRPRRWVYHSHHLSSLVDINSFLLTIVIIRFKTLSQIEGHTAIPKVYSRLFSRLRLFKVEVEANQGGISKFETSKFLLLVWYIFLKAREKHHTWCTVLWGLQVRFLQHIPSYWELVFIYIDNLEESRYLVRTVSAELYSLIWRCLLWTYGLSLTWI